MLTRPSCGNSFSDVWVTSGEPGAPRPRAPSPHRPARSGRRSLAVCTSHGVPARIVAGSSRMPGTDARARARNGGRASFRWAQRRARLLQRRRELPDRGGEVGGLGGQRARCGVEVRDQVAERPVGRGELGEQVALAADQAREVVRMLAQQRLVHDRSGPTRLAAVAEGLVDRLSARQPLDVRILGGVLGGGGRLVDRLSVPDQGAPQVGPACPTGARSGSGRSAPPCAVWVTGMVAPLDRSGALGLPGWRSRKKLPSRNSRGRRVTVDVLVDRQALVGDGERGLRHVALGLDRDHRRPR